MNVYILVKLGIVITKNLFEFVSNNISNIFVYFVTLNAVLTCCINYFPFPICILFYLFLFFVSYFAILQ